MKTDTVIKSSQFVIDASVVVKWFSKEINSEKAESLLQRAFQGQVTLYAPNLIVYEVGNALWKGKRLDGERITAALQILLTCPIELRPIDTTVLHAVVSIMRQYNLTFYDAAYAGLASILEMPLLTANPKDHRKVKEIKIVTI